MSLLATRLRSRRLELNLSQAELAKGICEQGQISRIEKGKYNPGAELLYRLSLKLNVPMNYFFDESILKENSAIQNFKMLSNKLLVDRDYASLKYLYELEVEKKQKLTLSDQLYLSWIESIILFHQDDKKEIAIKKLESIINKVSQNESDYFKFMNSLSNFYSLSGNKTNSEELYDIIISQISTTSISKIEDLELLIKVRYNHCRDLWLESKTDLAISEILETIDICKKFNHNYLLADLYCLLGNVSEGFSEEEKIKEYFSYSKFLYDIFDNEKMSLLTKNYIKNNF
ncbi:helix-turn-helix domain-containing protein [Streptococcus suis]|uniref:helix-turn-helix domain-containing protein n=1 Tax=Streptococcus suis TaxID=1307 RepID=UPI00042432E6|nr:helix-turn-helix domain-containing protein [Streptococcus suis]HEM3231942.1 helix-turn-helix transcriptional regulator [Streptococcus suis 2726]HEM4075476.1 helix-turn-helix transcriptional regulator [Streptococcus suis]